MALTFSAKSPVCTGVSNRRVGGNRRGLTLVAACLLFLGTLSPVASLSRAGDTPKDTHSFEQRASAEHESRSRFRRLEVASLVLILVCGGAVTLWAIRRK